MGFFVLIVPTLFLQTNEGTYNVYFPKRAVLPDGSFSLQIVLTDMKLKYFLIFSVLTLFCIVSFVACNYNPQETEDTIKRGNATIAADESLKPIVDAQIQAYQAHYPEATFEVTYVPEQKAINLMLRDSVEIVIVTRELNDNELVYFDQTKIKYQPAPMALDAATLIVNENSNISAITLDDLKKIFLTKDTDKTLVFDNSNSSNLSFMCQKLGIESLDNANIFAANGNADVFSYISRNKNAIGVVGYNWLSDEDNKQADSLRQGVRILKVAESKGKGYFAPTTENLRKRDYPLERMIYLHTTQSKWGVAKGFIRFSCSQIGQLVVEKMGLIPYYIIPKVYVIDNSPLVKPAVK